MFFYMTNQKSPNNKSMGAGPSLGKFLRSMDDDDLVDLVGSAYKLEPERLEKIFALVKVRYLKEPEQQEARDINDVHLDAPLSISTALLLPTQSTATCIATAMSRDITKSQPVVLATSASVTTSTTTTISSSGAVDSVTTIPTMNGMPDTSDDTTVQTEVRDPMNALWSFEGHPLRELKAADKNPQNIRNRAGLHEGILHTDRVGKSSGEIVESSTGTILMPPREVDVDGYPVIYGSCGRDKRYGRCSVCYFRGLRCNTAHYCASCQRSVCIRPRKYPGEEHHKICWNVLHMDKDMIQRVEKKKKRKLAAAAVSPAPGAGSRLRNVEAYNSGEADTDDGHGQQNSLSQSVADLHHAPSIPIVVADLSEAVDL